MLVILVSTRREAMPRAARRSVRYAEQTGLHWLAARGTVRARSGIDDKQIPGLTH